MNRPAYVACLLLAGASLLFLGACTLLRDKQKSQCSIDSDCETFGGHPTCSDGVCIPTSYQSATCFAGSPASDSDYLNQCTTHQCSPFDDCTRDGICNNSAWPDIVPPSASDAGSATTSDAGSADASDAGSASSLPACTDVVASAGLQPVDVAGSTAVKTFLSSLEALTGQDKYAIVYLGLGSCGGVKTLYDSDPANQVIKDGMKGSPASAFILTTSGVSSVSCSLPPNGAQVDVAASDVYASSCSGIPDTPPSPVSDYFGPIQPMTFVVNVLSSQRTISAASAHKVLGIGADGKVNPWTDPTVYFVRDKGSGTQQMIARAVDVPADKWWGVNAGGSDKVRDGLKAIAPEKAEAAIGILSTDYADPERGNIRVLGFQAKGQSCAFWPDSTPDSFDKANVRDGHYPIWGPVHLLARTTAGQPNAAAAAVVTRFALPKLDQSLVQSIAENHLIPRCAMSVERTAEMGQLAPSTLDYRCNCFFESVVNGSSSCHTCKNNAECPSSAPSCNYGFCESH